MENQKVLVTGTSSGFGLLIVKTLSSKGYTVFAGMRDTTGRNKEATEELTKHGESSSGTVHILEMDVTSDDSVNTAIKKALEMEGQIDVAVNNAGIGNVGMMETFIPEEITKLFDVNVLGMQRVNRAVLPQMRERKSGLLIHVSSLGGRILFPFLGPYQMSKFAVEAMAETYHYELAPLSIDAVIVEPGGYATKFGSNATDPKDQQTIDSYGEMTQGSAQIRGMLDNMEKEGNASTGNPQEVADAVLKLIETPTGERPLRTVVDSIMGGLGVEKLNDLQAQLQKAVFEAIQQLG